MKLTIPKHNFEVRGEPVVYSIEGTNCVIKIHNSEFKNDEARVITKEIVRCCNLHDELVAILGMTLTDFRTALDQWHGLSDELRGKEKKWIHNTKDPEAELYRQIEQGWKHVCVLLKKCKEE